MQKTPEKETKEDEFDLQALLAAEVTGIMAEPAAPEPTVEETKPSKKAEEDLVSRL